jgi:hypothetical protein
MSHVTSWTDAVSAVGTALTPAVVAGLAYVLTRSQSRSEELLRTRLDYYRELAPELNRLMCYMTFIGGWRDLSPEDVVAMKRRLDETFYCAAPLFSPAALDAYERLMDRTFTTFRQWGQDATIVSSAYRRRQTWQGTGDHGWRAEWDAYFTMADDEPITAEMLQDYRQTYDALIAAMARELDLTRARARYTTSLVSLNASAPRREDIDGSPG